MSDDISHSGLLAAIQAELAAQQARSEERHKDQLRRLGNLETSSADIATRLSKIEGKMDAQPTPPPHSAPSKPASALAAPPVPAASKVTALERKLFQGTILALVSIIGGLVGVDVSGVLK